MRLSRAAGLPRGFPDGLGIALRLPDLHGPGAHQDLLMTSSVGDGPAAHLLWAARSFAWPTYSSVMPYRSAGRLVVPVARGCAAASLAATGAPDALAAAMHAAVGGALRFPLAVAPLGRRMVGVGELRVAEPLPAAQSAALRFHPFHSGGSLQPAAGPLNAIRDRAYRGAERGAPNPGR